LEFLAFLAAWRAHSHGRTARDSIIPGSCVWFWAAALSRILLAACSALFHRVYMRRCSDALRAPTGAGFCYLTRNALAAAIASIVFGWLAPVGNFRLALLASSTLALAAAAVSWWLPEGGESIRTRCVGRGQATPPLQSGTRQSAAGAAPPPRQSSVALADVWPAIC